MPILTGALSRLPLGILADRVGGRIVYTVLMLAAAVATWMMAGASSYAMLLVGAPGLGLSGGSFAVGTSYVSRWHRREQQGTALGLFGLAIGRASCRERVCQYVLISVGAGSLKKK